jgi:hypothetical protein
MTAAAQTTPNCAALPIVAEREQRCREPYHWDDGVPYCDTCGMYRNTIALQERLRSNR